MIAGEFGGEACLLYSCGDGRILVFYDLHSQLPDSASPLVQELRSEETRTLVRAWVELYLGSFQKGGQRRTDTGTTDASMMRVKEV